MLKIRTLAWLGIGCATLLMAAPAPASWAVGLGVPFYRPWYYGPSYYPHRVHPASVVLAPHTLPPTVVHVPAAGSSQPAPAPSPTPAPAAPKP